MMAAFLTSHFQVDWVTLAAQATITGLLIGGLLWIATLFVDSRLNAALNRLVEKFDDRFASKEALSAVSDRVCRVEGVIFPASQKNN